MKYLITLTILSLTLSLKGQLSKTKEAANSITGVAILGGDTTVNTILRCTTRVLFGSSPYLSQKPDTTFVIFLEIPSGVDLNPVTWTISEQSNITLNWKRGYVLRHYEYSVHPEYIILDEKPYAVTDGYLYIDRKTKVINKVVFTINPDKL